MSQVYILDIGKFKGPLDKLLELVEEKRLPINQLSLATVTGDFLRYIEELKNSLQDGDDSVSSINPSLLADFIAIASRLILIKSKSLLPHLELDKEEEAELRELEEKLRLYKQIKPAFRIIKKLWQESPPLYSRQYLFSWRNILEKTDPALLNFSFPPNITPEALKDILIKIASYFEKLNLEEEKIYEKIIKVEDKIKEIIQKLSHTTESRFSSIISQPSKSELIASFLAILHLAHEQLIILEQKGRFSEIIIRKKE